MGETSHVSASSPTAEERQARKPVRRLPAIDAARGLALIGLMTIHMLPAWNDDTGAATLSWVLFRGDSAALFALLAGVGLGLISGGQSPHRGRALVADRMGVALRAVLIAVVGLAVGAIMPEEPPPTNILIYYAVFFVLAIPFLALRPKALFVSAMIFGIASPMLMQRLQDSLPGFLAYNPSFIHVWEDPLGTAVQLLLTGAYPALAYMTYLLVGMGLGRLDLREPVVQTRLFLIGTGLAVIAQSVSYLLVYELGGYQELMDSASMTEEEVEEALIWGPDVLPSTSGWWLLIPTPHTNTPFALASSLGVAMAVLGFFLLIGRRLTAWTHPLRAMGAMTLTLYTAHLVALSFEIHHDQPYLWFTVHLATAAVVATVWQRALGQGPLERGVSVCVRTVRRLMINRSSRGDPAR